MNGKVVIKGAGDIATGIAHRLHRSGYAVILLELPQPTVVRRTVAFAQAVFSGGFSVEGLRAKKVTLDEVAATLAAGEVPVLVDPGAESVKSLGPLAVVDARLTKNNQGTKITDAPVVIGVGPGFTAGIDVHGVVETMRGHDLGRVYYKGRAQENTGIPGEIGGYTVERVLRSPGTGEFHSSCAIGSMVEAGDVLGYVGDVPLQATIKGVLRGLIHDHSRVFQGMKIGDIDPRCHQEHCFSISDKARAIGGGVLEALLFLTKRKA